MNNQKRGILIFVCFVLMEGLTDIICLCEATPESQNTSIQAYSFSVTSFGAVGDGRTDDSNAFRMAFVAACSQLGTPSLIIPGGKTFYLSPIEFIGPCKSGIHVQILGNLVAPGAIEGWRGNPEQWIAFQFVDFLTIEGTGQLDAQGYNWWPCRRSHSLAIKSSKSFYLRGVKFMNSPGQHVLLSDVTVASVSGITIRAPSNSPNTDGIHMKDSQQVQIMGSLIQTGDDCISIGTGTKQVNITQINCGPGHGISVGSLGMGGASASVEQILVTNSSFSSSLNGVRIKTWQGGSGLVRNIKFEHLTFDSVVYGVVIDQFYCNGAHHCQTKASAVQINGVEVNDVKGTTVKEAIYLACSNTVACTDFTLQNINISSSLIDSPTFCSNVHGSLVPPVIPSLHLPCSPATLIPITEESSSN